jgi:hypothetical protein
MKMILMINNEDKPNADCAQTWRNTYKSIELLKLERFLWNP